MIKSKYLLTALTVGAFLLSGCGANTATAPPPTSAISLAPPPTPSKLPTATLTLTATPTVTPPPTATPSPTARPITMTIIHSNDTWGYVWPCG